MNIVLNWIFSELHTAPIRENSRCISTNSTRIPFRHIDWWLHLRHLRSFLSSAACNAPLYIRLSFLCGVKLNVCPSSLEMHDNGHSYFIFALSAFFYPSRYKRFLFSSCRKYRKAKLETNWEFCRTREIAARRSLRYVGLNYETCHLISLNQRHDSIH